MTKRKVTIRDDILNNSSDHYNLAYELIRGKKVGKTKC